MRLDETIKSLFNRHVPLMLIQGVKMSGMYILSMSEAVTNASYPARLQGHVRLNYPSLGKNTLNLVHQCPYAVDQIDHATII